jgi:hypothetical protein
MLLVSINARFLLRESGTSKINKFCGTFVRKSSSLSTKTEQPTILLRVRLADRLIDACADLGFLLRSWLNQNHRSQVSVLSELFGIT